MTTFFELIFILTVLLCFSTYTLYPLFIILISKIFSFKPLKTDTTPTVSILIAAYNEEKDIIKKIKNTLELDYPKEKLEILVGSDGSTDQTAKIVKEFLDSGIKLLEFHENRGKTAVQNDLVASSKNEILVFTDAASFLCRDSLRNLVKPFSDKRVGLVAGLMLFEDENHNLTTQSQGLYWKYERRLREAESKIGSMIGVDGPLYAVRKKNYVNLQRHIISDLMTPLLVLKQNKKVVLEKGAIVFEKPTIRTGQEFNTRRRITLRGLIGIFSEPKLINPFYFPLISLQIYFHKLLRWFVGPLVVLNFLSCYAISGNVFFESIFLLYVSFFCLSGAGWILQKMGLRTRLLTVPYYFMLVNSAAMAGIIDFLRKKQAVSWKPVRNNK